MRLLRGRAADHEADYERTRELVARVADDGEPALRVWTPHRLVAFGRRDANADGYQSAREIAREHGYAVLERATGGRAVAYTGTTVAFALAEPVDDARDGIQARYDRASDAVRRALADCGVDAREGEPADAFCPGTHSLRADGKIAGLAQRVRQDAALVAGIVVVRDHEAVASVLEPVYDALGVPLDPDAVGSVSRAGGTDDPDRVVRAIESSFSGAGQTRAAVIRDT